MGHSISLGRGVAPLEVRLIRSDPFTVVLRRWDGPASDPERAPLDWDEPPILEFPDAGVSPWIATISGNEATFAVDEATVDELIATRSKRAILTIGGLEWATGAWKVVN